MNVSMKRVRTTVLEIAYEESGPEGGPVVILLHGWPYDVHDYDAVVPLLVAEGCRVIVPYLRGFGSTRFLCKTTLRSGQQGALGSDLKELMEALGITRAALAGYDWGGRAACIASALWPESVRCLVTGNGYNIQDIPRANQPAAPDQEQRYWYQYYFHTERGREGLAQNRRALIRLLWRLWSPQWHFDDERFERSASSWDNNDFVSVTIQSYRHRYSNAAGDPNYHEIERRLAAQPNIVVPSIAIQGEADGVQPPSAFVAQDRHFAGGFERRTLPHVGHNVPAEEPGAFARAILDLIAATP